MRWPVGGFVAIVTVVAAACAPAPAASTEGMPIGRAFDYQLGGAYAPPEGARLVVRDSTASPADGLYNVCYVNGFQTQPGERDEWLEQHPDLVLRDATGEPVTDPDWPDEMLLDTSTAGKRTTLAGLLGEVVGDCADKGFDAVEFDNLDSFTRSKDALTADDNLAYARLLATGVHDRGLLVGQKNAAELSSRAQREADFDFAVAEECVQYDECTSYSDVYGEFVFDIEYPDNLDVPFPKACDRQGTPESTILRDRDLVRAGEEGYEYRACRVS